MHSNRLRFKSSVQIRD